MAKIIIQKNETTLWYKLVAEAQTYYGHRLDENLENYLVLLLQAFCHKPEIARSVLALEYHKGLSAQGNQQAGQLRETGDKCLIFSGFYPERAEKINVPVSYFIHLGRQAYANALEANNQASQSLDELLTALIQQFVQLVDILHCIHEIGQNEPWLSPLLAEELWTSVQSQHALAVLEKVGERTYFTPSPKHIN